MLSILSPSIWNYLFFCKHWRCFNVELESPGVHLLYFVWIVLVGHLPTCFPWSVDESKTRHQQMEITGSPIFEWQSQRFKIDTFGLCDDLFQFFVWKSSGFLLGWNATASLCPKNVVFSSLDVLFADENCVVPSLYCRHFYLHFGILEFVLAATSDKSWHSQRIPDMAHTLCDWHAWTK